VSAYRVYRMDGAGRISKAEWIDAESDEIALESTLARLGSTPFELWQGGRLVAKSGEHPNARHP